MADACRVVRRLRDEVARAVHPAFTPRALSRRLRGHCLIFEQCPDHFLGSTLLRRLRMPIMFTTALVTRAGPIAVLGLQMATMTFFGKFTQNSLIHALTTEQFGSQPGYCAPRLGFANRWVHLLPRWLYGQVGGIRTRTDRFTACDATITTRT